MFAQAKCFARPRFARPIGILSAITLAASSAALFRQPLRRSRISPAAT